MVLNQISIFLENKAGQLSDFIQLLAEKRIDLEALSIAETQDYGILRIIVQNPEEVVQIISDNGWVCKLTPVLAVYVPDESGSLKKILSTLAGAGQNIAYTYAFLSRKHGHACIIIRVEDNELAVKVLSEAGIAVE